MKQQVVKYYFTLILALVSATLFAGNVTFKAAVSKNPVATGERIKVSYTINSQVAQFIPPDFDGFQILSGPNQSTSMSWVNGVSSYKMTYSFILLAVKEGEFEIAPAKAKVGSEWIESNPLHLTVVKGKAVTANTPSSGGNTTGKVTSGGKDIFIRAVPSKSSVYVGEPITVTFKLYTRVNIVNNDLVKMPDLNGFWNEEVDLGQNIPWSTQVIDGKQYNVATIRKVVLFPQSAGDKTIDPLIMTFVIQRRVQRQPQSIFDQFFGSYEEVEVKVASRPYTVKVKPFPEQPPADFTGGVGKLNLSFDYSPKDNLKSHEAITVKLKISGTGNLKLLDNPDIQLPSDFEIYDPKINDRITLANGTYSGYREYEYLLIPRHAGDFVIPPVTVSYFDLSTKKFKQLTTDSIRLHIEKGDETQANVAYTSPKEEVKQLATDINYIQTNFTQVSSSELDFNEWLYFGAAGTLSLAYVLLLLFVKKQEALKSNTALFNQKQAGKIAAKYLKEAKAELQQNDRKKFLEALHKGLMQYLSKKFNVGFAEMDKNIIREVLQQAGIDTQSIEQTIALIEKIEFLRYAPVQEQTNEEILQQATEIIHRIEKQKR